MSRSSPEHKSQKAVQMAETIKPGLEILEASLVGELKTADLDGSPEQQAKAIELVRQLQLMSKFEAQLVLALSQGQAYLKEVDNG